MTPLLLLNDVMVWSLQIGLVIAMAAAVPPLLQLKIPKVRLAFWQLVLVTCLVLPLVRSWKQDVVEGTVTVSTSIVSLAPDAAAGRFPRMPIALLVLLVAAAGVVVRFGWLGFGVWRLHRYRLESHPLAPDSPWGVEADLRICDEIASPVTFGYRRPVVLLPTRFSELDEGMRDAILCHEILHVRRRDWLYTVGEEIVRALFWFHPAIWWLLREIQLVREQAVDREVVEIMRSHDQYIEALLVIAGAPAQSDLAPAPLFLRKGHLKRRVVSILKEAQMSKAKSICAFAASVTVLATSCWFITGALPLRAAPQVVEDAAGVSVETNGAELMHRQSVSYPRVAIAKGVQGTVVAQVKLDAAGNVSDASIVSGPEELRKPVLESILNWHFSKDAGLSTQQVSIRFEAPQGTQRAAAASLPVPPFRSGGVGNAASELATLKKIIIAGLSDQQQDQLLARLPVHEGDSLNSTMIREVAETLRAFDEHLSFGIAGGTLSIAAPNQQPPPPPPPPPPGVAADPGALRIAGEVQQANLVSQPKPVYPAAAKEARVQGTVKFEATIGTDGAVQNLTLLSGPPLLVQAAMQGVRQWIYKPTLLNGNPVPVITTIDVHFTLIE